MGLAPEAWAYIDNEWGDCEEGKKDQRPLGGSSRRVACRMRQQNERGWKTSRMRTNVNERNDSDKVARSPALCRTLWSTMVSGSRLCNLECGLIVTQGVRMPLDLVLLRVARALIEVAGFALLGQGLLALLAGKQRHANPFYKILATITTPVIRLVRYFIPRHIADSRIPLLTFFLLFCLWIGLAWLKHQHCVLHGLVC